MTTPIQTSEPAPVPPAPAASPLTTMTRSGLTIRREDRPHAKWTCRIRFQGKVHWLTLCETAEKSMQEALRARRAIQEHRFGEWRATTALRQAPQSETRLGEVFRVYRQFTGLDRPSETTREQNIHALSSIVRDVLGPVEVETLSILRIDAQLAWKWKELKRQAAAQVQDDDERAQQLLRSANSRLRQAKSLFSEQEDLRAFYRHHQVELPACVSGFAAESPFADCAKQEYHPPSDAVIAATFSSLANQETADPNLYRAVWLACGFGLRKSEIAAARCAWFQNIAGVTWCRGDVLAKNKKFPEIRVQLGAWDHLRPHIEGRPGADYVLSGNLTERQDTTFRRISEWMRALGWQTTHHTHEFRAWAGCQIAMSPGNDIRSAQAFLRHASYATTEKFYGHHLKIRLAEVPLRLPTPAPFTPLVLPAAG